MTVRNLSPAQQSYIWAVARFSWFFRKSRTELGMEQVRAYQLELIRRGLSSAHINQVSAALRFVFGVTLGRPEAFERIVVAKMPKRLPIVLSREEMARLLDGASGLRDKAALATAGTCPRSGRRPDPGAPDSLRPFRQWPPRRQTRPLPSTGRGIRNPPICGHNRQPPTHQTSHRPSQPALPPLRPPHADRCSAPCGPPSSPTAVEHLVSRHPAPSPSHPAARPTSVGGGVAASMGERQ